MDKRFPIEDQIDMLGAMIRGRVVTPRHEDYDGLRAVALGNFDARPGALVRVANAVDVATVLNFARATGLPVAVRGGGHSTCGHSGCDNGLVIDLRDLKGLDIDAGAQTVWCGAGLTAGEVTGATEPHGLIVGFGDSADVGIGGLTLGGGIGFLARKHGLTVDSLLAAEIVTANGDILMVDADNHPDLFWALRGGGGNFGVVTRLKFRLHALPSFVGGPLMLPATPEVVAGFVAAAEAAPDELTAIGLVMPCPPLPFLPPHLYGQTVLVGMMAFAGDIPAAEAALAPFRALATPIADLVRPAGFNTIYMPEDPIERPSVSVRTLFTDHFGADDARAMIAHVTGSTAPVRMAQIRVLGGAVARVPAEATAFGHRASRAMVAYLALYGDPRDAALHEAWAEAAIADLRRGGEGCYVNFVGATESAERARAAYPAAIWDRLRQVKHRYDPENLFRRNQNIPPA